MKALYFHSFIHSRKFCVFCSLKCKGKIQALIWRDLNGLGAVW